MVNPSPTSDIQNNFIAGKDDSNEGLKSSMLLPMFAYRY
jgi:hypothetical protein